VHEISRKFKLSCMRNSLSHCLSVIFRGRCGSRRQTGMLEQQCKLYYCSLSPQCHSVIFRGRCGSGGWRVSTHSSINFFTITKIVYSYWWE